MSLIHPVEYVQSNLSFSVNGAIDYYFLWEDNNEKKKHDDKMFRQGKVNFALQKGKNCYDIDRTWK